MIVILSNRRKVGIFRSLLLLAIVPILSLLLLAGASQQVMAEDSPDMMISPDDIAFSKLDVIAGEEFVVYAYVMNVGNVAGNATVRFYFEEIGYPIGIPLGETNVSVAPGGSTVSSINISLAEGIKRLSVSIDDVVPEDSDLSNNVASTTIEVFRSLSDVQFSTPTLLLQGTQVTVQSGTERIIPFNVTVLGGRALNVSLRMWESSGVFAGVESPSIDVDSGQTVQVYLRISAPELNQDSNSDERKLLVQAIGSNAKGNVAVVSLLIHPSVEQVSWWNSTTAALAAAGALSLTFGAIHALEPSRYKLLGLIFPLYTKLKKENVLDQYARGEIHGYIKANPGDYFTSIGKALGITGGNLAYHLRVLEREGQIVSSRDGSKKRFYPRGANVNMLNECELSPVRKNICKIIRETPGIRQKDIASLMGVTSSTVSYHIQKLLSQGTLRAQRKGMSVRYYLKTEKASIKISAGKSDA